MFASTKQKCLHYDSNWNSGILYHRNNQQNPLYLLWWYLTDFWTTVWRDNSQFAIPAKEFLKVSDFANILAEAYKANILFLNKITDENILATVKIVLNAVLVISVLSYFAIAMIKIQWRNCFKNTVDTNFSHHLLSIQRRVNTSSFTGTLWRKRYDSSQQRKIRALFLTSAHSWRGPSENIKREELKVRRQLAES